MTKFEYVQKLRDYTGKAKISIYDYYSIIANKIRSGQKLNLMQFELDNPFTKPENIQLLVDSEDPQIIEYYASMMTKTVTEYEMQSRKEVIREGLNEALDNTLGRKDITQVIEEQLGELTRADVAEAINEKLDKEPKRTIKMTSISTEHIDQFSGFTVLRESKEGEVHLYYYDGKDKTMRSETTHPNSSLRVGNGYYINYEEFMSHMIDELSKKYPNVEEIQFVKGEQVMTLPMVMEEVYVAARQKGLLRFGTALETQQLEHYQEVAMNPKAIENYQGNPMQTGVYVRRSLLAELLSQYQARLTVVEEDGKEPTK